MKTLERKYNGTFPSFQVNKILNYYGLFIPSVLCSSYKKLYSSTLTEEERKRVSLFGILTPIGDDLFDVDNLDAESIEVITFSPGSFSANTFSASVAKEIQSYLLSNVPHKAEYIEASRNVFEIQLETIRQTNPAITSEEIETITYAKGGYSVIIYHQALDEAASTEMQNVLFNVGALMQLANDFFDIYKDTQDGIFTLANRCQDYNVMKELILEKVKKTNLLVRALPYPERQKNEFLIIMHAIISRSLVSVDQMIRLQEKTNMPVVCIKQDRKELITDMQKLFNIARWFYYAYKLPKLK